MAPAKWSPSPYLFAQDLPREARIAAATATYGWIGIRRRTKDGCCPLGVALRAAGFSEAPPHPDSRVVSRLIFHSDEWTPFRRSVSRFIMDWDALGITEFDLPAALGVAADVIVVRAENGQLLLKEQAKKGEADGGR